MTDGPDAAAPGRLEIGRVGRPHGLRGDVTVAAVSNRPERFAPGSVLYSGDRELVVMTARQQPRGWVVHFQGVDDRDGAERIRGVVLSAPPLGPLEDEDEIWVHELIGATLEEHTGRARGHVVAVQENPAHDLLVLEDGTLVPIVFVVTHEPGRIVVDVPDGLFADDPVDADTVDDPDDPVDADAVDDV